MREWLKNKWQIHKWLGKGSFFRNFCLKTASHFCAIALAIMLIGSATVSSSAAEENAHERQVFHAFEGQWSGQGEVVAGKYKGTRFNCTFVGMTETVGVGLSLDGSCRAGLLRQAMKAKISRHASGGFLGAFNDGAKAQGMDITAAKIGSNHIQLNLNRQQLQGVMLAQLENENKMSIALSVKVLDEFVQVVGLNLKRSHISTTDRLAQTGRLTKTDK